MKMRNLKTSLPAIALSLTLAFTAGTVVAQDSATSTAADTGSTPELSYGVPQVLQLAQSKVPDSVIINYIQNSGTIFALRAPEIVYLKQQGVSEDVLTAMLNQRSRITGSTEPSAPVNSTATAQPAIVVQPVYVQTAQSPTVYIIPDSQTARYTHHFTDARYGFRYGNGFDDMPYSYSSIVTVIGSSSHPGYRHTGFHAGRH